MALPVSSSQRLASGPPGEGDIAFNFERFPEKSGFSVKAVSLARPGVF